MNYWKTANNTPKVLRKEKIEPSSTQRVVYWTGIALCAILPVVECVFNSKYYWLAYHG
jgi:hypothetical protein